MVLDGSFKSLLGGVSQQIPRERLPGQLSVQENMLTDPVTGIRRRPGLQVRNIINNFNATANNLVSSYVEIGNAGYNLYINSTSGEVVVTDTNHNIVDRKQSDYLKAPDASYIKDTMSSGYGWIVNTSKVVTLGPKDSTKLNPIHDGYFYIRTGAFMKLYSVRVEVGGLVWQFDYSTPQGTDPSQVQQSTPEGVAASITSSMTGNTKFMTYFDVYRQGAYVYFTKRNKQASNTDQVVVTSTSGQIYVQASNAQNIPNDTDLPAKLDSAADGMVMSVGLSSKALVYYKWDSLRSIWQETGDYSSAVTLSNMPIRYTVSSDGILTLDNAAFEGRISGDDTNNPYPNFVGNKLTGISSFQGRLVLLSGAYVALSGSNQPLRFLRSTVTTLRDDDPIETGSGSATAASFEYAVQFNKDLILIASTHQAVMPTQNTALTPANAMVVLTSKQNVDTRSVPQVVGRTLMYCSPVSEDYFGVGELNPSAYTNSQYSPQNLTDHIPRYIPGRCRQIVASNTANIALFTSTADYTGVLVHEYLWSGEDRSLMAWHHWTFPADICSMHFARELIVVCLKVGTSMVMCTIDPRVSAFLSSGESRPFLDVYSYVDVVDNKFTVPVYLRDAAKAGKLCMAQSQGVLAGEPIGIESIDTTTWTGTTVRSFKEGQAAIGWKFTSAFAPTPPMVRDKNDVVISTAKTTILRYEITVQKSGEFNIRVQDTSEVIQDGTNTALTWSSVELGLDKRKLAEFGTVVVPCRSIAHNTEVLLSTDGTLDLNVLDIEYTLRTVQRRRRL